MEAPKLLTRRSIVAPILLLGCEDDHVARGGDEEGSDARSAAVGVAEDDHGAPSGVVAFVSSA